MEQPQRRRRRVRTESDPPIPSPADLAALTSAAPEPEPAPDDRETERGLRGLVGGGSSQVKVTAALRARDATRPTEADLAAAEANLIMIRRGWAPPTPTR